MTEIDSCYKAFAFRDDCRDLGIKHVRTKPCTPKTNGKAERFIQTALREWPTLTPIQHPIAGPGSSRSGCTDTIGIDPMAA